MQGISFSIVLFTTMVASVVAQVDYEVTAYWTNYNATKNNWDYNASKVFCAAVDGGKPLDWRSKYGWTGFCGSNGPQGVDACGLCLNVTNIATGETEKVRIVDACGSGGLVLDLETAFKPIDTDGKGITDGHLIVNYEFVDCEPVGPGESNVTAYWTNYKPTSHNWNYTAAHVSCAAVDGDKPLQWRSKYGWTGFCGNAGPKGDEACGKCLKVTNRATKDDEIVRIVDACGSGGLVLDLETGFQPIDSDGEGHATGSLFVDYEFVDCGDSIQDNNEVLVYSE